MPSPTIKAIETHYAGCRFRSRLEARWAVFFDNLGIRWEYEPQGYELDDGTRYLPDFWLPECDTWIEVKGSTDNLDLDILQAFAEQAEPRECPGEEGPRLMLLGPIPPPPPQGDYGWLSYDHGSWSQYGFGTWHKQCRPWFHCNDNRITPDLVDHMARWMMSDEYPWTDELGERPTSPIARYKKIASELGTTPKGAVLTILESARCQANVLSPSTDPYEWNDAHAAYTAARSARFEHGERG